MSKAKAAAGGVGTIGIGRTANQQQKRSSPLTWLRAIYLNRQAVLYRARGQGSTRTADRSCAGPAWHQHYGLLQAGTRLRFFFFRCGF